MSDHVKSCICVATKNEHRLSLHRVKQQSPRNRKLGKRNHASLRSVRNFSLPKEMGGHREKISVVDVVALIFIGVFVSTTGLDFLSRPETFPNDFLLVVVAYASSSLIEGARSGGEFWLLTARRDFYMWTLGCSTCAWWRLGFPLLASGMTCPDSLLLALDFLSPGFTLSLRSFVRSEELCAL